MTERTDIELLPCPFCGDTDIDPSMASGYHAGDTQRPIIAAGCSGCGAVGPTVSVPTRAAGEAQSVTAWNARAGEWINVKDRTPRQFVDTVLVARNKGVPSVMPAVYDGENFKALHIGGMSAFLEPTHWMPLPALEVPSE